MYLCEYALFQEETIFIIVSYFPIMRIHMNTHYFKGSGLFPANTYIINGSTHALGSLNSVPETELLL